jgi:trehalose 6-phosphate synthase
MATAAEHRERAHNLIFVSNRLPFTIRKDNGIQQELSNGDLVTALAGLVKSSNIQWFGVPGVKVRDEEEKKRVGDKLKETNATAVFVEDTLAYEHYDVFSNSILWPILHYQFEVDFDENAWQSYQRVNEIFADTIAAEVKDGNLVWIHDYHLMLVPKMLRARLKQQGKDCKIGFTLHSPYPAQEFWKKMKVQRELVAGVLAGDVVGFHTDEYKRNFIKSCASVLGARTDVASHVAYDGRRTFVDTFTLGIDPQKFNDSMQDTRVLTRIDELDEIYEGVNVILGVDRLDHTKRLLQKLQGYEYLFKTYPELIGKVTLIQILLPSAREDGDDYEELETEINRLTVEINESENWSPLVNLHHKITFIDLTSLMCVSKVCFMASRRGGMNLVASEYVACQENRHGVLVLSELSGAVSFTDAGSITFHPSKMNEIAEAIYTAIMMGEGEKEERYNYLRGYVTTHTSAKYGREFINSLSHRAQIDD